MDNDTFSNEKIINFANDNLISLKIDAEKGSGPKQKEKYRVRGYPTIIILDNAGNELDRIIGYLPPDNFLKELNRIKNGTNTLSDLQLKYSENSNDIAIQLDLAKKYIDLNVKDSAKKYLDDIQSYHRSNNAFTFQNFYNLSQLYYRIGEIEVSIDILDQIVDQGIDSSESAYFYGLLYKAKKNNTIDDLMVYVENTNDTTRKKQSYWQMIRTIKKNDNDPSLEAQLYLKAVNLYDKEYKYLASLLNSFAWRMTEIGQLLPEALEKVNNALEIEDDLKILDTKAEVLWKLGRVDEAIEVINECIQGNPEYQHYQDQKAKFLATKAL
ncbi:MAG: hypothetical protein VXA50_02535 [bacterium]